MRKITVNLAPSSLRKAGSGLDLAIAVGVLVGVRAGAAAASSTPWPSSASSASTARSAPVRGMVSLVDALAGGGRWSSRRRRSPRPRSSAATRCAARPSPGRGRRGAAAATRPGRSRRRPPSRSARSPPVARPGRRAGPAGRPAGPRGGGGGRPPPADGRPAGRGQDDAGQPPARAAPAAGRRRGRWTVARDPLGRRRAAAAGGLLDACRRSGRRTTRRRRWRSSAAARACCGPARSRLAHERGPLPRRAGRVRPGGARRPAPAARGGRHPRHPGPGVGRPSRPGSCSSAAMNPCPCGSGRPGGLPVHRRRARPVPRAGSPGRCSTASTCGSTSTGRPPTSCCGASRGRRPRSWPPGSARPGPGPATGAWPATPTSPGDRLDELCPVTPEPSGARGRARRRSAVRPRPRPGPSGGPHAGRPRRVTTAPPARSHVHSWRSPCEPNPSWRRPELDLPDEAYLAGVAVDPRRRPGDACATSSRRDAGRRPGTGSGRRPGAPTDLERLWARHQEAGVVVCGQQHPDYPVLLGTTRSRRPCCSAGATSPSWSDAGWRSSAPGTPPATASGWPNGSGERLGAAGVAVVSGLALGVDGAVHRGLLRRRRGPAGRRRRPAGSTSSIPAGTGSCGSGSERRGCWSARCPLGLARRRAGASPPATGSSPALSEVVVVVESRQTGGSLYTADSALLRDLPLLAVPGPITSPAAYGTNRLIADGATPVCAVDDVFVTLGLTSPTGGSHGGARARWCRRPDPRRLCPRVGHPPDAWSTAAASPCRRPSPPSTTSAAPAGWPSPPAATSAPPPSPVPALDLGARARR